MSKKKLNFKTNDMLNNSVAWCLKKTITTYIGATVLVLFLKLNSDISFFIESYFKL